MGCRALAAHGMERTPAAMTMTFMSRFDMSCHMLTWVPSPGASRSRTICSCMPGRLAHGRL